MDELQNFKKKMDELDSLTQDKEKSRMRLLNEMKKALNIAIFFVSRDWKRGLNTEKFTSEGQKIIRAKLKENIENPQKVLFTEGDKTIYMNLENLYTLYSYIKKLSDNSSI